MVQGAVLASESVKEAISLTSGSVADARFARYRYPPAQMIHPGGSVIPHLQDNQQYISFSPRPYGLTGDKANKLASAATGDDGHAARSERTPNIETLTVTRTHAQDGGWGGSKQRFDRRSL